MSLATLQYDSSIRNVIFSGKQELVAKGLRSKRRRVKSSMWRMTMSKRTKSSLFMKVPYSF